MPLIVQDDTASIIGANAYIDSTYADAYFVDRGIVSWDDLDGEIKDAAIMAATSYIDNANSGKLKGVRLTQAQFTQFPRNGVYDYDGYEVVGIPELLRMATAEYAIRAASSKLAPDIEYADNGIALKSKKEKIGPLEEVTVYQDDVSGPITIRKYPEADMLLQQYVKSSNHLVRA